MSLSFAANVGSFDSLNVRTRCGASWWASRMRCTDRKLTPAAFASIRPVQCVASPGGGPVTRPMTSCTVSAGSGALPGLRVLSRSKPSTPSSMNRACQVHTTGFALPDRRMISAVPQPAAVARRIWARHTCFCGAQRSEAIASSRWRSGRVPLTTIPALMTRARTASGDLGIVRMNQTTSEWHPKHGSDAISRAARKEEMMAKVSFLGLGVMGYPMAGHLRKKGGHEVTVYNRTAAKAEAWVKEHGGRHAPTPRAAAEGQDVVMMCVGNDHDVREVTLGANGAFEGVKRGAVFVDHTTASAEIARELHAEAKKRGFAFIDAPVSGGEAGAVNGVLTVMCGGEKEPFARAEPVIAAYARACKLLGTPGSGQLAKMVNQICIAGLVQGLSEAIHFAKRAGLDVEALIDTISKGAAQSWQMENRYKTMAAGKFDFGFAG